MWKMAHLLWQNDCWHESNFHFPFWLFGNRQIAWWFEIKITNVRIPAAWKALQSRFLVHVMREIKLRKPVWKNTVFCLSVGRKLPGGVLPQKYQPFWQPLQSVAKNCVRFKKKMHLKIQLQIPLSGEYSSSKEGSASRGLYLAVAESEYIGKNRGLKGRGRADGDQTGCIWSHQLHCEYCRAEVQRPHQGCDIQGLFPLWHSNGIFYGDFTFSCLSTWKETYSFILKVIDKVTLRRWWSAVYSKQGGHRGAEMNL